ncbi:hypothetical protein N300_03430, partial [Calypte anna]
QLSAVILGEQQKPNLISIKLASIPKNPNESRLQMEMAFSHFDTDFMRHFM